MAVCRCVQLLAKLSFPSLFNPGQTGRDLGSVPPRLRPGVPDETAAWRSCEWRAAAPGRQPPTFTNERHFFFRANALHPSEELQHLKHWFDKDLAKLQTVTALQVLWGTGTYNQPDMPVRHPRLFHCGIRKTCSQNVSQPNSKSTRWYLAQPATQEEYVAVNNQSEAHVKTFDCGITDKFRLTTFVSAAKKCRHAMSP